MYKKAFMKFYMIELLFILFHVYLIEYEDTLKLTYRYMKICYLYTII